MEPHMGNQMNSTGRVSATACTPIHTNASGRVRLHNSGNERGARKWV